MLQKIKCFLGYHHIRDVTTSFDVGTPSLFYCVHCRKVLFIWADWMDEDSNEKS